MSVLTTKSLKVVPSATTHITFTSPGTAVWTAWTQFIASTPAALQIAGFVATPSGIADYELEVGIGASGSEQPIGSFLFGWSDNSANAKTTCMLPIPAGGIPMGSRVSVRMKADAGTYTLDVCLLYYQDLDSDYVSDPAAFRYAFIPDIGITPGENHGVPQNASTTPWANVTYAELTAGFSLDVYLLGITHFSNISPILSVEVDLASGAAGSEVVLTTLLAPSRVVGLTNVWLPAPLPVPANTRIAYRTRSANSSAGITYRASLIYLRGALGSAVGVVTQMVVETLTREPVVSGEVNAIWMGDSGGMIWID